MNINNKLDFQHINSIFTKPHIYKYFWWTNND